ncbi:MAG TPA: YbhB/YbcL family Raf kinase inhibitor-like protein [Kofleriaceae bacterium]|nr:YbhB/YbcL family Raf kinase inhibitor-like protein [Kofleriaceae bacterium]
MKPILSSSLALGLGLALTACGGDDGGTARPIDAAGTPADAAPPSTTFTLTTTAFPAGGTFATDNTCHGANTSPAFTWSNPPANARSFALVLTDLTIMRNHWVLYNIPVTATGVPAHIENVFVPPSVTGAQQTVSIKQDPNNPANTVTGYYGPCPPAPGQPMGGKHDYLFTLYAIDIDKIPGGTAQTTADQEAPIVASHMIASATFAASYTSP